MAKIEVSQVAEILKKHKLDPSVLREIVEEMNEVTAPAAGIIESIEVAAEQNFARGKALARLKTG